MNSILIGALTWLLRSDERCQNPGFFVSRVIPPASVKHTRYATVATVVCGLPTEVSMLVTRDFQEAGKVICCSKRAKRPL